MGYDYHLGFDTNNAGSEPEAVSDTVKAGVVARLFYEIIKYFKWRK